MIGKIASYKAGNSSGQTFENVLKRDVTEAGRDKGGRKGR